MEELYSECTLSHSLSKLLNSAPYGSTLYQGKTGELAHSLHISVTVIMEYKKNTSHKYLIWERQIITPLSGISLEAFFGSIVQRIPCEVSISLLF